MPKLKGLLVLAAILLLSLLLAGCNLLPFIGAEPDEPETLGEEGLPEWLLSEHRGARSAEAAEDEDELLSEDEEDEESDEDNDEPTGETAEQQPTGDAAPTQPQQQEAGADTSFDSEDPAGDQEPQTENVTDRSWRDGSYTGEWLDGSPHGRGTFTHPSGAKLAGNWLNGNPDGRIRFTDPSGRTETMTFDQGNISDSDWWNPDSSRDSDRRFFD